LYFVAELARQSSIKVLLSGEGGDEAFGGYPNYRNLLMLERLKSVFGPGGRLLSLGLQALVLAGWKRFDLYARLADTLPKRGLLVQLDGHPSLLDLMLYIDTKTWLPDDLLVKADYMSMAASVELRVPLLDFQILEFAASLPQHYKVRGWKLKRILKAALTPSVPKEIIVRKKTGFPVPYDYWLRQEMKEFVFDTLLSPSAGLRHYFRKEAIVQLIKAHQQGRAYAKEVFSLLVLELWHQQFIGAAPLGPNRADRACTTQPIQ
jgi:asparagine synthase (glutamine-hydrolysing)